MTRPDVRRCGAAHCHRIAKLVRTRDGWRCERCANRMPSGRRRPTQKAAR